MRLIYKSSSGLIWVMTLRLVLVALSLFALVACTSGPSESDVTTAVSSMLKDIEGINKLTGKNTCGVMRGPVTDVTKVEIAERGEKNEKEGYWPLRVKVTGKCQAQRPNCGEHKNDLCPPEPAEFEDVELEVRVTKDDFGKFIAQAAPRKRSERGEAASHAGAAAPPPKLQIDPKAVTEVVIKIGDQPPVTLQKNDATWRLGDGTDAYTSRVEALLENLGQLKASVVVAEKPSTDALARYELTDGKSIHVLVKAASKTVADMKIGKSGSRGVMALIDDKVVAVSGLSRFLYDRKAHDWKRPE